MGENTNYVMQKLVANDYYLHYSVKIDISH